MHVEMQVTYAAVFTNRENGKSKGSGWSIRCLKVVDQGQLSNFRQIPVVALPCNSDCAQGIAGNKMVDLLLNVSICCCIILSRIYHCHGLVCCKIVLSIS